MISNFSIENTEVKGRFINEYSKNIDTRRTLLYDFQKATLTEKQLKKDLYAFDLFDIQELVKAIDTTSEQSLRRTLTTYESYVQWCIKNGLRENETGVNFFTRFLGRNNDLTEYISRIKASGMYLKEEDLFLIVDKLANEQHQALVLAIYEGILGTRMFELRSLKMDNISISNNTATLYNENSKGEVTTRTIQISDKLIQYLMDADMQKKLIKNNGEYSEGLRNPFTVLSNSEYVFKSGMASSKDIDGHMVPYPTMTATIKRIGRYMGALGLKHEFLTPRSIYDSGMINKVLKEYQNNNIDEITPKTISKVFPDLSNTQAYNLMNKISLAQEVKD